MVVGYLTPFRGYRFQISGNKKGEGDLGSSPVIPFFRNEDETPKGHTAEWLYGQIMCALVSYSNSAYCLYITDDNPVLIPKICWMDSQGEIMKEFIDECIKWIYR